MRECRKDVANFGIGALAYNGLMRDTVHGR